MAVRLTVMGSTVATYVSADTGWKQTGSVWSYYNVKGVKQTGWQQINGAWYYFNGSRVMQTDWIQDNGKKYYLESNGVWNPNAKSTNNSSRPDGQLLDAFQKEIKVHINNQEENITMTYKSKNSNINEVMDGLVKEYDKAVESNEYLNYNIAHAQYSVRGIPGNYTFTYQNKTLSE